MGVLPGHTAVLIESTPYRLRYLLTSLGRQGGGVTVIPNAAGASPDLRTDAASLTRGAGTPFGAPLYELVSIPTANQARARALLLGESAALPAIVNTGRHAHADVTPRVGAGGVGVPAVVTVDANEGAAAGDLPSAGYPVLVIYVGTSTAGETCYLDLHLKHSYQDWTLSG